jgi:beta-phosphoglucomutase-like phosphatase (HAD superfamily)
MAMPMETDMTTPHASDQPQAILFDLDGTLVDTVGIRVESWLEIFADFDIHVERAYLAPLIGTDGKLLARMGAEHTGVTLPPGGDADIERLAGERFAELNQHPRPLTGAAATLAHLDAVGMPWAIATSSRPDEAVASVASLGLETRPLVIDGSDVEHAKPAPDLLIKGAHQLDVAPGAAWYVGDSRWDMQAAVAGGMVAIGVTTGATSADQLRVDGARATYDGLPGLLDALSQRDMPPGAAR